MKKHGDVQGLSLLLVGGVISVFFRRSWLLKLVVDEVVFKEKSVVPLANCKTRARAHAHAHALAGAVRTRTPKKESSD